MKLSITMPSPQKTRCGDSRSGKQIMNNGLFLFANRKIDWVEEFRGLLSLLLFLSVTAVLLQSISLAILITASLGFHELGHILLLSLEGIPWRLRFGGLGAWTETPLKPRAQLSSWTNSLIHLAGPIFSLIYAMLALVVHHFWLPDQPHLLQLANLNAQIALFNLLPLGEASDGGKFMHKAFASLNEVDDRRILLLGGSWGLGVISGTLAVGARQQGWSVITPTLVGYLLMTAWLLVGMLVEKKNDNPLDSSSPRAMSYSEVRWLMVVLGGLLLVSTALAFITPFWLPPEHILSVIDSLLHGFVRLIGMILHG